MAGSALRVLGKGSLGRGVSLLGFKVETFPFTWSHKYYDMLGRGHQQQLALNVKAGRGSLCESPALNLNDWVDGR